MSTLNGVNLLLEDPDGRVQAWMDKYLPLDSMVFEPQSQSVNSPLNQSQSIQKRPLGIARVNYPPPPRPRINTLYWPTGAARWAVGWLLTTADDLNTIAPGDSEFFSASPSSMPLVLTDDAGDSVTADVFLLSPRPISSVDENVQSADGTHQLYLLPVVDQRYYWQGADAGTLSVIPNVPGPATTWANVYAALGTALGVTIAVDSIEAAYLNPDPEELTRPHQNAAVLLDAVAHSVGQRIVVGLDGEVAAVNLSDAYDTLLDNVEDVELIAGATGGEFSGAYTVRVVVRKYTNYRPYGGGDVTNYDNPTSDIPAVTGCYRTIFSTAYADFTAGAGSPGNNTNLMDLADQITTDYEYQLFVGQYDGTYSGLIDWVPAATDDHTLWNFGGRVGQGEGSEVMCWTRVQSMPPNVGIDVMLHQDPACQILGPIQVGKVFGSAITSGGSGACHVWWSTGSGAETDSTLRVTGYDWTKSAPPVGRLVDLLWDEHNNRWYIGGGSGGTLLGTAVLSVSMSSTTTTAAISSLTPWDGSSDASTSISNPNGHAATNTASVTVARDMSSGSAVWKVIDAPKVDVTFIVSPTVTQQVAVEVDGSAGSLTTTACSS
jgi:hypothetical protein